MSLNLYRAGGSAEGFATTHWSVVFMARDGDAPRAFAALERLCRAYWRPVYAYIRRDGSLPADAQDLTQEFFHHFIEKEWIGRLQHQRGKFRSFLLTFLKHFLSDQRQRAGAQKRGGRHAFISIEEMLAEEALASAPTAPLTADEAFEQRWAQNLVERGVCRLRAEYVRAGKGALFDALKDVEPGERGASSYAQIGERLGMTEGAVKSAMHRMRLRHREILRAEIARTTGNPAEVDEEIRHLIYVLA